MFMVAVAIPRYDCAKSNILTERLYFRNLFIKNLLKGKIKRERRTIAMKIIEKCHDNECIKYR